MAKGNCDHLIFLAKPNMIQTHMRIEIIMKLTQLEFAIVRIARKPANQLIGPKF